MLQLLGAAQQGGAGAPVAQAGEGQLDDQVRLVRDRALGEARHAPLQGGQVDLLKVARQQQASLDAGQLHPRLLVHDPGLDPVAGPGPGPKVHHRLHGERDPQVLTVSRL